GNRWSALPPRLHREAADLGPDRRLLAAAEAGAEGARGLLELGAEGPAEDRGIGEAAGDRHVLDAELLVEEDVAGGLQADAEVEPHRCLAEAAPAFAHHGAAGDAELPSDA